MNMAYFLLKTEPSEYSFADLERDGKTVWSGIANATALIHLRSMRKGDEVLIYHTGGEKACVGIAEVTRGAYPDPGLENEKLVVVDIKPKKRLARPVSLDEIKRDKAFAGWDLLRIGRLSVVPTSGPIWKRILQLSDK